MEEYLNKRIVIKTYNNIAYAGIAKDIILRDEVKMLIVELDPESRFAILCPLNFVKYIKIIPITEEQE
jgi:hypothetical protein